MTTASENFRSFTANEADQAFSQKASQVKALVEELCRMAPQVVGEKVEQLQDDGCHMFAEGQEKVLRIGKQAVDTMRKHPVETALIAVAAGLATWWLINRK